MSDIEKYLFGIGQSNEDGRGNHQFDGLYRIVEQGVFPSRPPPSCEEEDNLRLLAETDLGEKLTANNLESMVHAAVIVSLKYPVPTEIFVSPYCYKLMQECIVHTGHDTSRKVK